MKLGATLLVASLALAGCTREPAAAPTGAALGNERADCRPDGSCDPGLWCLSNLCVRPPPADCQTVADHLASIDLGTDVEPEVRASVTATYKAACTHGLVSKEQGACLEKARDRWAAAQCAPSMFPEMQSSTSSDCGKVSNKLRAAMGRQTGSVTDARTQQMFSLALGSVQESCEQDSWPELFKKCILLAGDTTDALQACNAQISPALQQKLSERMMQAMQPAAASPQP